MGARLALTMFEENPDSITKLVLLAPDGLKVNKWYWLATQSYAGSRLFSFTMKYPQWFLILMNALAAVGLVNSSIYKFVRHYIQTPEVRELLFKRWICMRKFRPSLPKIKKQILSKKIPIKLLYGKHDKMILPARGKKFQIGIESFCTLHVIDSGHQVLHEKNAALIAKLLET